MNKKKLQALLAVEAERWSKKSYLLLERELQDVVSYARGQDEDFHQFEVQMLDHDREFVHVVISVDDGRFRRTFQPLSEGFWVYRDGRVER